MRLTISKKFEISLSYRLYNPAWTEGKNREVYGQKVGTTHGFGGNFNLYTVFDGPVDPKTGMLINVVIVKERIKRLLAERYDHKFLNRDTQPFDTIVPTPENIIRQIFKESAPLFAGESANLTACHLTLSPWDEATAYANGTIERHYLADFSAARRTYSPHLGDEENSRLFGIAASPSGHGHHYTLRVTLADSVNAETGMLTDDVIARRTINDIVAEFDHRNITTDIPEFKSIPNTTECLARYFYDRLSETLPVTRVKLHENPWFYCEYTGNNHAVMGIETNFNAAHRLHSPKLSDSENCDIYGKCNNPAGHGHRYRVEAAFDGQIDRKTGMLYPLDIIVKSMSDILKDWNYKHLDADTGDFTDIPSTGENIITILQNKINERIDYPMYRLRLWETPNNRFTLRR
ncbi:MAG: 6-carboxytetrahydropterin synthase [Candidatus Zixiibacteriota bacterium]